MRRIPGFLVILLCALPTFAEPLIGVILEEGTDRPIPYVDLHYKSGKYLGQADGRGRIELQVDSKNAILVLSRNGYDSTVVELQDYPDLLDVTISMRPNVRDLGSATITGSPVVTWENPRQMTVQKLEDAAGMRFDVAEHLSQMPGISGQKDFSSELFYDGSRSEEVAYHLGRLRIPNMRHLDVGFPGNLSVVNPHALKGLELHDHYGSGPLGQGLATSVQFQPDDGTDDFRIRTALGTTLRELYVSGPSPLWDSFVFSARYLDPSMLKNMGEKFFTEFRKRDATCKDCTVQGSDPFTLSAKDFYLRLAGTDSSHDQWAVTGLWSDDSYAIRQDTSSTIDAVNNSTIIEGSRSYKVAGVEYNANSGFSWHAGFVRSEASDTLRDTSGFRTIGFGGDQSFANFIDGYSETYSTYSLGGDKPLGSGPLGSKTAVALLYERQERERNWPDFARTMKTDLSDNVIQGSASLQWKSDLDRRTLALGAIGSSEAAEVQPTASLDLEHRLQPGKEGLRLFGNTAWRADWDAPLDGNSYAPTLRSGASLKAGVGYAQSRTSVSMHGFGRYYPNPALPVPQAFAQYREQVNPDYAWVSGASATAEWRTLHHFALGTNLSSTYGEYELPGGGSLPWTANARLDMVSHLRVYPRNDSMISVILTHRAAWHRPLYAWDFHLSQNQNGTLVDGTRSVRDAQETTDLYRTDLRMNLDLKSKTKIFFLENVRFYVEADNVFSTLDNDALRFLGADNARQRSVVVVDNDGNTDNGARLEPFLAKGMGLYLQFGVEGNFGF